MNHPTDILYFLETCEAYQKCNDDAHVTHTLNSCASLTTMQASGMHGELDNRSAPSAIVSLTMVKKVNDGTNGTEYSLRLRLSTGWGPGLSEAGQGTCDRDYIEVAHDSPARLAHASSALGISENALMCITAHLLHFIPDSYAIQLRQRCMSQAHATWLSKALLEYCGCFPDIGGSSFEPTKKKSKLVDLRE